MNHEDAVKLAVTLKRESMVLPTGGRLKIAAVIEGDRIVFIGGRTGSHSLAIDVSSPERVLAHWEGYVENNGLTMAPKAGAKVEFPSASAWRTGGYRRGVVVSVGPKRAKISYVFKHGGKATTTIRINDLRFL